MARFTNKTDSPEKLFNRYTDARDRMLLQRHRLEDGYDLSLPNRANFRENLPGQQRNLEIFDTTAIEGVQDYANDIQSILMPPYQRWARFVTGQEVPEAQQEAVQEELDDITDIVFRHLEQSNFYQVSAEALEDVAISTGIMMIEEGTQDNPLVFRSMAISEIAFSEGRNGKLQNFWRKFRISLRQATLMWPLDLTSNLQMRLKDNPDGMVELIEGFVLVPGKTELTDEFQYYIQDMDSKKLLLNEKRNIQSFYGFRAAKTTGEMIGYGPILRTLPSIRALNGMQEWDLRAFKFAAMGPYLVENSGVINPFTVTIEAGSIIPIESSVSGKDPIRPLQTGGQPQIALEKIRSMQLTIRDALTSKPLPAEQKSGVSATDSAIRERDWIRRNGAVFGRLTVEMIEPSILGSVHILAKKKIIPEIIIDKKRISIKYESPLIAIQDQEDLAAVEKNVEFVQATFGAQGVAVAFDQGELNKYVSEKSGVPVRLVNSPAKIKEILEKQQEEAQQQAQQQQSQLAAGQVQQPQLPLAQ